ncbi:MAG: translation initiation factor IF-6 [Euryarchaeota archaeon]|nr:translation initiation factor IF-6 [Euryarchaeota archaeon]MBU4607259.1 translation initiation factor IF-6 [Euryarchaeota archaeon]MBV1730302.1 translation initiation factor IF-6 [Methanobacterium sp.]MBV1754378.1 translation initiation factor IF-6 [Methanobacterium sp.]
MIKRINLNGNPNLGVYLSVTDEVALVPLHISDVVLNTIKEALEIEVLQTSIAGSSLAGALTAGNSQGFLVSPYTMDREINALRNAGIEVEKIPDKYTALGNIMMVNDNGALVSPLLSDKSLELINTFLEVDAQRATIAGFDIVGSVATATNKGALLHPHTSPEELKLVEKILKVPADVGTVNKGVSLVGACSVTNSNGVIVSENTTGPEMARIEEAFGFLEGYL